MNGEPFVRHRIEGDVARVTLARLPLNILTTPMMAALSVALDDGFCAFLEKRIPVWKDR